MNAIKRGEDDSDTSPRPPRPLKHVLPFTWAMILFCCIFFIHLTGIYLFTKGFLLTRLVLDEHSSCLEPPGNLEPRNSSLTEARSQGCWHPKSFDKAVVIIIDALRYDFAIPSINSSNVSPQPFQNALICLHELASEEPHNAFLRPFIADPPTTTVQRLKGLTTGTLPTFIDAGSNFAGDAIEEDSLLYQLKAAGQRLVHLGDDTWTALFPGYFDPELSRPYESLVVEDLHTVDNGVIEHIFPLLAAPEKWDVIIAHFLGVDHAGHEHGPYHPAMRAKLAQMDRVIRDVVQALDDDTLLVIMGDHGMDSSGNHGGESDDEIQAALWMYSRQGIFGRTSLDHIQPPSDAMTRPVNQIDLVPTLALLLGIPIPFNSLGSPIEEAFVGRSGKSMQNFAEISRLTALGMERYQAVYSNATGKDSNTSTVAAQKAWDMAVELQDSDAWAAAHHAFSVYQAETLSIYKGLWTTFDLVGMMRGISISVLGVILLHFAMISLGGEDEPQLARFGFGTILQSVFAGSLVGLICSLIFNTSGMLLQNFDSFLFTTTIGGIAGSFIHVSEAHGRLLRRLSTLSVWSWLGFIFVVSQSVGFASNSYLIWEDSILLFFLATFAMTTAAHAFRQDDFVLRTQGIGCSILFAVLGRIAFYSQRCREEQMPTCHTTYFGATGSMAAIQTLIPLLTSVLMPLVIDWHLSANVCYSNSAKTRIHWALRFCLVLSTLYWFLNSADKGDWFEPVSKDALKLSKVRIAQMHLVLGFPASIAAIIWGDRTALRAVTIRNHARPEIGSERVRYLYLLSAFFMPMLLVQELLGAGSLFLFFCHILLLAEILHTIDLQNHSIGPIILGILGSFHFFRTGHQATLSSIQWRSAFTASFNLNYPWSPLLVLLNTFGAQILAAIAVPLLPMWKYGGPYREEALMRRIYGSVVAHLMYYAVLNLSTMMWAGLLRRHLMLYRVFCPRFMMGAVILLVVDLVCITISLVGARWSLTSGRVRKLE